jgi:hypothetical protein
MLVSLYALRRVLLSIVTTKIITSSVSAVGDNRDKYI